MLDCDNEAGKLDQAISQDLHDILESDEATVNLINMIRYEDMVHEGRDEATLNLVTKLEAETKAEENKYNQEKDKIVKEKTKKKMCKISLLFLNQNNNSNHRRKNILIKAKF